MATLTVGQAAPAFTVKAHTGEDISLSDYAGKKVIIWFYPRTPAKFAWTFTDTAAKFTDTRRALFR